MSKRVYLALLILCTIVGQNLLILIPAGAIPTNYVNEEKIRWHLFLDRGARAREQLQNALKTNKDLDTTIVYGEDIRHGCLKDFDVLIVPGGSGKKESRSLEEVGRDEIRRFVLNGGIYMGICAGCYLLTHARPEYLGLLPLTTVDKEHWRRGKARLPIEFTPLGMEVFGVSNPEATVVYHNGPVMKKTDTENPGLINPLCYFRGEAVANGGTKRPDDRCSGYGHGQIRKRISTGHQSPSRNNARLRRY